MKAEKKVMDFFPITTTDAVYINGTNKTVKEAMDNGGGRDIYPDEVFTTDNTVDYDPFILNTKPTPDDFAYYQKKQDDSLNTNDKTVVGSINEIDLENKENANNIIKIEGILDGGITPENTTFFKEEINLFNKDDKDIQVGKYIGGGGTLQETRGSIISGFINVEEQKTYIYKYNKAFFGRNSTYLYYGEENNLLGHAEGIVSEDGSTCTITTKPGTRKVKINSTELMKDMLMFVKGTIYPSEYKKYNHIELVESVGLNTKQKTEIKSMLYPNPLYGKIITANGDSICYGAGYKGGFIKIIAERNQMIYDNKAESGATITANTRAAAGYDRHWVCRTISTMREDADYCLLEGGVNDASLSDVPFGTITENMNDPLDDTTFCGAFESMLKQAVLRFKGKKIGFILVHRIFTLNHKYQTQYYPAIIKMCEKWGVPICNLHTDIPSLNLINELKTLYTKDGDGWHPNEAGYREYYCDKIEHFLLSL